MPLIIPDDIEHYTTTGEEVFCRFLRNVAKPDERYIVWYSPDINDSEPDFILYCPDVGLIVFEVKDWAINQICEVNPKTFIIKSGSKEESRTNPHEQARGYVHNLLECIRNDGKLVNRDGFAQGKPKIPISYGVVFPNINSYEYKERFSHDGIIPTAKIFFWDDLDPHSELGDPSGRAFLDALRERFEPKFPCHISSKELNHLRQLLYPTIRINSIERGPQDELKNHEYNVKLLDHHQEAIARRMGDGHRLVSGPSGCGKTLVLVHQAIFLRKYNPSVKRILFLCYNVTLVNYIRRLLAAQGAPLGPDGVEVLHFYDLCERLTSEKVLHENQDMDYYNIVLEDALSKDLPDSLRYDAILLDEGQDFSDRMLQVVMKCLNRKTDFLTIALDEGQDLYGQKRSWSNAGINVKGRKRQLNVIYRNTKEIAEFANRFRNNNSKPCQEDNLQHNLFPDPRISNGPCPTLKQFTDFAKVIDYVAKEIKTHAEAGAFPLSEIAVMYTMKKLSKESGNTIPAMLASALDRRGILNKWLSEDYRAKRSHDITANSVTITTIHSAKGLDFAYVFLIGLDLLEPGERWPREQIDSLVYVGITRARYQLEIPYVTNSALMERIVSAEKPCVNNRL
ncbi:ATP-dependent helicase/nuclease subunit A [Geobacter sp. OR-1]|uniref:DEAD/DEAH box helicase n=1 Tax=Geobacter sp. OR-1 TaxID=1266765 RepID=UPI000543F25E|nr:3'-5' exonuclease [Geobacter sp. OR-1]GAM10441.1 ATP-dependent helicase/nuclease subunit A [Geobacter sp. OR-1]